MESKGDKIVLSKPPQKEPQFMTIGYEGRTLEMFISLLKNRGVELLIDVREIPISRKKGFSKNALKESLESSGIKYVHLQKLGSPKNIRNEYKSGGSEELFFESYSNYVDTIDDEFMKLLGYVHTYSSAIMCFERDYIHCHRKILAEKLSGRGLYPIHI